MLAYITGSGFYDHPALSARTEDTRFGGVTLYQGTLGGRDILMLPRHGAGHHALPHQINHRSHLLALKQAGATAVISCSVCGLLRPDRALATPLLADNLLYPDNRLGDGGTCTVFDQPGESGRGHLLASSFFHAGLTRSIEYVLTNTPLIGTYAHVPGPRFNSTAEIRQLQNAGAHFLSQTCGPEAVLANELELPFALLGFGIDYANGVKDSPTPIDTLNENLSKAKSCFTRVMEQLVEPDAGFAFENFIYRFD